ncbi:MAG: CRTAC1 family protein [Pseudomonadota bacterium]|nr:CRTAC1 family protein [Pseudomonadota bacterium]
MEISDTRAAPAPIGGFDFWQACIQSYQRVDPRIPVAVILFTYLLLGLTVLGFNRSPLQAIVTTAACVSFELFLTYLFHRRFVFPLSAVITSFSLSFLLNYSHGLSFLYLPVLFAIGSKYLLQYKGKHALNPAMVGVSFSLLFSSDLVTAAPAYQWNGIAAMSFFVIMLGLLFVIPKVNRHNLVFSFLIFFTLQTAFRAWIMKHHLPFETLFLGTLSSPSFFIFTFFMITDPSTSPKDIAQQRWVGFWLAAVDLLLHLKQSYYTFFYAALIVGLIRLIINHVRAAVAVGPVNYLKLSFWSSKYYRQFFVLAPLTVLSILFYRADARIAHQDLTFYFEKIDKSQSGLNAFEPGDIFQRVDVRVQHVIKWLLSIGDAGAAADVNNDGKTDLFLTNLLKKTETRSLIYLNEGDYRFHATPLLALTEILKSPEVHGLVMNGVFADYDNDGDQDLFLPVAFGSNRLLKNLLIEKGKLDWQDVTQESGLYRFGNSMSAAFADFNQDGLLDLVVLNVIPETLPDYSTPQPLNLFSLPQPEYAGDQRMFNFMHESWHQSNNGGLNYIYFQTPDHKFLRADPESIGLVETRWSLAVGVADLNQDSWPDIYIANDFGPDDLYYNIEGKKFENIKGIIFGSIGRDTYKGMNVSIADYDRTGWLGVYVSNVHHALQAEGSLLWTFLPGAQSFYPKIEEEASQKGVLNESRFGWGAVATDFDNDGWVDISQANGMVDDTYDRLYEKCPDYWYVNEKVARSPPSIHRYASHWGDIRGHCIFGKERNRLYWNRGTKAKPQYVDVAESTGLTQLTNSRGVISADFENRGRRDLLFTHQFQEPSLYKNISLEKIPNQWVGIELQSHSQKCNRQAIGTRVILQVMESAGKSWSITQETQNVSGLSSQSDGRLHFGLGANAKGVSATLFWCGKWKQDVSTLLLNQYNKVVFP